MVPARLMYIRKISQGDIPCEGCHCCQEANSSVLSFRRNHEGSRKHRGRSGDSAEQSLNLVLENGHEAVHFDVMPKHHPLLCIHLVWMVYPLWTYIGVLILMSYRCRMFQKVLQLFFNYSKDSSMNTSQGRSAGKERVVEKAVVARVYCGDIVLAFKHAKRNAPESC